MSFGQKFPVIRDVTVVRLNNCLIVELVIIDGFLPNISFHLVKYYRIDVFRDDNVDPICFVDQLSANNTFVTDYSLMLKE